MKQSRRMSGSRHQDRDAAGPERQESRLVVIEADSDFVRCPNRGCSALLPLHEGEQLCGYCGRWTGPLGG